MHLKRTLVSTRRLRLRFQQQRCCGSHCGADSRRLKAVFLQATRSKEAHNGNLCPPPRQSIVLPEQATIVPLEQLWMQLPQICRQELLGHLTRMVAQRLAPPDEQEAVDE